MRVNCDRFQNHHHCTHKAARTGWVRKQQPQKRVGNSGELRMLDAEPPPFNTALMYRSVEYNTVNLDKMKMATPLVRMRVL